MKAFWKQWNKGAAAKAVKLFALSVGATALCMLGCLGFLSGGKEPSALEASIFNGGKEFAHQEDSAAAAAAQDTSRQVIPLGSAFGIKLFTDGVIVASLSDIYTEEGVCCPAAEAGILPGDYLLQADGQDIPDNGALARYIGSSQGEAISFQVRREDQVFSVEVTPVYGEGSFKTGMWVRDSAAGIGTLTFYDPATGVFAGLGHGICDMDTNGVMALKSGEPAPITLSGIVKGQADSPGQLRRRAWAPCWPTGRPASTARCTRRPPGRQWRHSPGRRWPPGRSSCWSAWTRQGPSSMRRKSRRLSTGTRQRKTWWSR